MEAMKIYATLFYNAKNYGDEDMHNSKMIKDVLININI